MDLQEQVNYWWNLNSRFSFFHISCFQAEEILNKYANPLEMMMKIFDNVECKAIFHKIEQEILVGELEKKFQENPLLLRACQGDSASQLEYGLQLIKQNESSRQGLDWLLRAATQENIEAQYETGRYYTTFPHIGYYTAIHWFTKAASQGCIKSMMELGKLYKTSNLSLSKEWYEKAGIIDTLK